MLKRLSCFGKGINSEVSFAYGINRKLDINLIGKIRYSEKIIGSWTIAVSVSANTATLSIGVINYFYGFQRCLSGDLLTSRPFRILTDFPVLCGLSCANSVLPCLSCC